MMDALFVRQTLVTLVILSITEQIFVFLDVETARLLELKHAMPFLQQNKDVEMTALVLCLDGFA